MRDTSDHGMTGSLPLAQRAKCVTHVPRLYAYPQADRQSERQRKR